MALQNFNRKQFQEETLNLVGNYLNCSFDSFLIEQIKEAFIVAAPWREKAYLILTIGKVLRIPKRKLMLLAIVSELIMVAALTADDVFDNSDKREGRPSLFAKKGTAQTILVAEAIYGVVILILSDYLERFNLNEVTKRTISQLFFNAYFSIQRFQHWRSSQTAQSLKRITPLELNQAYKFSAGLLFRATLSASAYLSGQIQVAKKLETIGEKIGVALQLSNDISDFTWGKRDLGRDILEDITNKQPNIVLAYFNQTKINQKEKELIQRVWFGNSTSISSDRIKDIIQKSGAIELSRKHIQHLLDSMSGDILNLPVELRPMIKEVVSIIKDI